MKIRDFIQRGRELYACCPGRHDNGALASPRRVAIDLAKLDPEMTIDELRTKVRCSICGKTAGGRGVRGVLLIPQTDRQMRQGRQR